MVLKLLLWSLTELQDCHHREIENDVDSFQSAPVSSYSHTLTWQNSCLAVIKNAKGHAKGLAWLKADSLFTLCPALSTARLPQAQSLLTLLTFLAFLLTVIYPTFYFIRSFLFILLYIFVEIGIRKWQGLLIVVVVFRFRFPLRLNQESFRITFAGDEKGEQEEEFDKQHL